MKIRINGKKYDLSFKDDGVGGVCVDANRKGERNNLVRFREDGTILRFILTGLFREGFDTNKAGVIKHDHPERS